MENFIKLAGESLTSFRYFDSRPLTTIKNHFCTLLGYNKLKPVVYGHLDIEDGSMWLGTCVSDSFRNAGYGTQMMEKLIQIFQKQDVYSSMYLSVDKNNNIAINLYKKFGFVFFEEGTTFFKMRYDK